MTLTLICDLGTQADLDIIMTYIYTKMRSTGQCVQKLSMRKRKLGVFTGMTLTSTHTTFILKLDVDIVGELSAYKNEVNRFKSYHPQTETHRHTQTDMCKTCKH